MASSNIASNVGILALVVGSIIMYVSIMLMRRNKKTPQKSTVYLTFATISWSIGVLVVSFIYLYAGTYLDLAKIFQVVMYGSIFSGIIFTYMFARNIFFKEHTKFYVVYVILGIIAIVILGITDSSYVDKFPDSVGGNFPAIILKTEYSIILVVYMIPTLIGIVVGAFRTAKRINEKIYARGFQVIGLGQIFTLLTFVCDTIATVLITDAVGYAVFLYAQWICTLFATICLYVGWTMPGWFKRLYGIKTENVASKK